MTSWTADTGTLVWQFWSRIDVAGQISPQQIFDLKGNGSLITSTEHFKLDQNSALSVLRSSGAIRAGKEGTPDLYTHDAPVH